MTKLQTKPDGTGLHGRSVAAALDLINRSGAHSPELAQVAAAVGIPDDDLRQIFPDANALVIASVEESLVRLLDRCVKAVVQVDPEDSVGQFQALGEAYIAWALDERSQYRLLHEYRPLCLITVPRLARYIDSLRTLMMKMLDRARAAGHLSPDTDTNLIALSSWAYVNGLTRSLLDGRISSWYPGINQHEAALFALRDFVQRYARTGNWAGQRPAKAT